MIFVGEPKIVSEPMLPVRRHWICPTCQNGEMVFTGEEQGGLGRDHMYVNRCNNPACKAVWRTAKRYPCIEFIPVPSPPPKIGE